MATQRQLDDRRRLGAHGWGWNIALGGDQQEFVLVPGPVACPLPVLDPADVGLVVEAPCGEEIESFRQHGNRGPHEHHAVVSRRYLDSQHVEHAHGRVVVVGAPVHPVLAEGLVLPRWVSVDDSVELIDTVHGLDDRALG